MINNLRWIGVLGAVYVACAAVGTAQASPGDRAARGPGAVEAGAAVTGTTPMWLAALGERSAALNREYGLGDHTVRTQLGAPTWLAALGERSAALNRAYGLGDRVGRRQLGAPGSNWLVALRERSDAMNRRYGLGEYGGPQSGAGDAGHPRG